MEQKNKPAQAKEKFAADEVLKANYLWKAPSRTAQFKTNPKAYKVNPDGSISTAWELNYFN